MYAIDDRLKWAIGAFVALIAVLFATGILPPPQESSVIRLERDIYIIDSTSTQDTWESTRESIFNRLKNPFGQYPIDGNVIASESGGAMADMVVIAVSPNSLDQSGIEILTGDRVTEVWDSLLQGANYDRAATIYDEILAPNNSVWEKISTKFLPSSSSFNIPSASECENFAASALGAGSTTKSRELVEASGKSTQDVAELLCGLIIQGLEGIAQSEQLFAET